MVSHTPLSPTCGECKACTFPSYYTPADHDHWRFEPLSIAPTDGINFRPYEYPANQMADAFSRYIPGHMDWEIKKNALERWNSYIPEIIAGPEEFDLLPIFDMLDDFLFLKALGYGCTIKWVDPPKSRNWVGRTISGIGIRNSTLEILIVRPTAEQPRDVRDIVCTIMHEMCHALLKYACTCSVCRCELNVMNGRGLSGHGPAWERLRASVEEVSDLYLREPFEGALEAGGVTYPFSLSYEYEPDREKEGNKRYKLLHGLYEKAKRQDLFSEWNKKNRRETKNLERKTYTKEGYLKLQEEEHTLQCIGHMFMRAEQEARTPLNKMEVQKAASEQK